MIQLMRIVSHQQLTENVYQLEVTGSAVRTMHQPGQFVNIRIDQGKAFLLRRPISICEINQDKETFTMLYRVDGEGTRRLSEYQVGQLIDIVGPLGQGYDIHSLSSSEIALLVGGGIGIPPLYELAKQFHRRGIKTIHILGFQTKKDIFYEQKFSEIGETYIATMDGSYGFDGHVISLLKQQEIYFDKYYACGPIKMLKALTNHYINKEGYISIENRMACGIGACYACVVKQHNGHLLRVCCDGPVFKSGEVQL